MSIYFYCMILVWLILCLIQKALLASSEKVIQKDETSALSSDSKWGNDQKLTQTLVNNEFKLQDRIDFLGYIKIYDSDDKVSRFIDSQQGVIIEIVEESSYRMDLPSIDLTFSDTKAKTEPKEHLPSSVLRIVSIESGTDVFQDVDSSAESIVVLGDERYMQFNSRYS